METIVELSEIEMETNDVVVDLKALSSNPKRKSGDIAPDVEPPLDFDSLENLENTKPNENTQRKSNESEKSKANKKSKTSEPEALKDSLLSLPSTSSSSTSTKSRASALPKLNLGNRRASTRITGIVKQTGSSNIHSILPVTSTTLTATVNSVTNLSTAITVASTTPFPSTPHKSLGLTSGLKSEPLDSSRATTLMRSITKKPSDKISMETINHYFQSGISVKHETITTLTTSASQVTAPVLKSTKSRRTVTAMAKCTANAAKAVIFPEQGKNTSKDNLIKELSGVLNTLMSDIEVVRSNCTAYETVLVHTIDDLREKVKEYSSIISALKDEESRHKQAVLKTNYDNDAIKAAHEKIELECQKLRIEVKEIGTNLAKVEEQLRSEEKLRIKAESIASQLENEMNRSKSAASQSINEVKEEYNQRIEQSISGYKHEISSLRAELQRKQDDLHRSNSDRVELEKKSMELQQEIYRVQSLQREAENAKERLQREVEKLTNDINGLRDQSMNKDTDLRTTLMSLSDFQRQSGEEKSALRAEISTMLIRIKALEDERLSIMTELSNKKDDYSSTSRELQQYKENITLLENKLVSKESENIQSKEIAMQLEIERELRSRCEVREEAERRERIAACAQLIAIQNETNTRIRDIEERMSQQLLQTTQQLQTVISERDHALDMSKQYNEKILGLDSEIIQLKHALDRASAQSNNKQSVMDNESVQELSKISGEVEILRRRVRDTTELKAVELNAAFTRIAELEEEVRKGESQRRKLHNIIQELRGNIRVFARVRPFLPSDGVNMKDLPDTAISTLSDGVSLRAIRKPGSNSSTGNENLMSEDRGEEHLFTFDRVFGPSSSQETIFHEVSEFVQSALDGYNVCLFAYGMTGSGKTHTMQGSGNGSMKGIIPRAMEQIGKYKSDLETRGWKYEMEVCFIEIYNETIRDLLRHSPNDEIKHDIKRDPNGGTYVSDVTMMAFDPNDTEKIDNIMELAARHRSVGQTLMNDRSSRSHSVFTVYLTATNEVQNVNLKGTLSLVDLAGSERLDRSGATGTKMKETVAINKSLSSLVDVFTAIGNKQSHIPFRNSKLTYLLQSALSGDGKTLMLVNVSPTEESYYESLCSLRLARQVNQCELGKPKRQCASGATVSSSSLTSSSSSGVGTPINSSSKSLALPNRKASSTVTGPSYKSKA